MRILFLILCCIVFTYAKTNVYLLPQEAINAKKAVVSLIEGSKESITIAMYNFSYKKFAKALVAAKKRGLKVRVIFDSKKIKDKDSQYAYLKNKGIECMVANKKMHLKVALFDDEKMLIGSTNFTKKSFSENYEILFLDDHKKAIKKIKSFLNSMI